MTLSRRLGLIGALVTCIILTVPVGIAEGATWPMLYKAKRFDGANQPVFITGDGTGSRLYIVEKPGRILVTPPGSESYTVFLDLSAKTVGAGEGGLLGLAFPPDFATSEEFYVYYTNLSGDTVISRFAVDPGNGNRALPASEEIVLTFAQPLGNHNGGWIGFGPDGYLYVASGDGGGGGDPGNNAQDLSNLLGTMLRIDVVGEATYAVPADNPFTATPGARDEIWSYGLRNPWRCSFDPGGNLWIGDVGQSAWEELNFQSSASNGGENYGWNRWEGRHAYPPGSAEPPRTGYTFPVWEYRTKVDGHAIVGGYVYDGATHSGMRDTYFCGDYLFGTIWGLRRSGSTFTPTKLLDTEMAISSFGEGDDGALFVCSIRTGEIYELRDAETYSDRLWGGDRFSTAVAIARRAFDPDANQTWPGVRDIILASGDDRAAADPLSAAGLSWAYDAPILLTSASSSPPSTGREIAKIVQANGRVSIHVVGGTTSIPDARLSDIRDAVAASLSISRSQADALLRFERPTPNGDRYGLAASIARRMDSVAAVRPSKVMADGVLIANGADSSTFFDALALSPVAAHVGTPILLTGRDSVPGATRAYIASKSPANIIVGGGPATVTWSTYRQLRATDRWFGGDRYAASADIANEAVARGWSSDSTVGLTARLPDGLTGGAAAGHLGGVQLVTKTEGLPSSARHYLTANRADVETCYVFGGPKSIGDSTRYEIARLLD